MKLGIKVTYTRATVADGPAFNNNETLTCHTADVRPFLQELFPTRQSLLAQGVNPHNALDESSRSVILARFFGTAGYLLAIVKARGPIEGEPYDNTAVWVHIPAKMDISGEQTLQVIEEIFDAISDPDNINANHLQALAAAEYPEIDALIAPVSSKGKSAGIMEYGGDTGLTLANLLGPEIRQPAYVGYSAIAFLDRADHIAISSPEAVIATGVEPMVTIPVPPDTLGFKPYIGGMPFNRPVQVAAGQSIVVIWKRSGYKDILLEVDTAQPPVDPASFSPGPEMLTLLLRRDRFSILDENKHAIHDASISINGKAIGDVFELPESALAKGVTVRVSRQGFSEATAKLTTLPASISFILVKKLRHYEFALPAYDRRGREMPEKMKVTVESRAPLTRSPFRGFATVNETIIEGEGYYKSNPLRRVDNSALSKLLYALAGAAVAALIFVLVGYYSSDTSSSGNRSEETFSATTVTTLPTSAEEAAAAVVETADNLQQQPSEPPVEAAANAANDIAEALAYMNSKWVWEYDELEKYDATKGLYDDFNNFNLERLVDYWSPRFPDCKKLQNVLQEVSGAIKRGYNPKASNPSETFVKNHKGIVLEDYRKRMLGKSSAKPAKEKPADDKPEPDRLERAESSNL